MLFDPPPDSLIEPLVRAALAEDLGLAGDITSNACLAPGARIAATFRAREVGVICGLACARLALAALDPHGHFDVKAADGARVEPAAALARVEADARAVLGAERVALNIISRLSGIATLTSQYVQAIADTSARIVDTRKTSPLLRALEKYAVRCGGGYNHRFGLGDAVLIKDNHVAACGGVGPAIARARSGLGHLVKVEVEVDTLEQLKEALSHNPDVIMLDNFSLDNLRQAVAIVEGRILLEASGGVSLTSVRAIAETGVNLISVGSLTHSSPIIDIGLDVD